MSTKPGLDSQKYFGHKRRCATGSIVEGLTGGHMINHQMGGSVTVKSVYGAQRFSISGRGETTFAELVRAREDLVAFGWGQK